MLFFRKKKEEKDSCCCKCTSNDKNNVSNTCCGNEITNINSIKVLGAGCKSCHELYQNVIDAVAEMGIATDVQYITDMEIIMGYGVISMPAILINDTVASYGKVLKTKEICELLKGY